MTTKLIFAITLLLACCLCFSADIYSWKDEQGRVNMSDSVPERYRSVATKINSKKFELSESDKAAAAERRAKENKSLATLEARRNLAEVARIPASGPGSTVSPPSQTPTKQGGSECDRLWAEYFESQECFAPYQNRYTGTKPEAYLKCKTVTNPSYQCGPAKSITGG